MGPADTATGGDGPDKLRRRIAAEAARLDEA